jgi:NADH-quinone oxidoreductase subunit C
LTALTSKYEALATDVERIFGDVLLRLNNTCGELTYQVTPAQLTTVCEQLRDTPELGFDMLMDVSGVEYLSYGRDEWETHSATGTGFSRGVAPEPEGEVTTERLGEVDYEPAGRFAVSYHLLSIPHNRRLRLKAFCEDPVRPRMPSVIDIWAAADWYEREVFDLFGVLFDGHPDLRRLLTDYGFIGHPFRKDFPLTGHVEVRYDPNKGRVVYEPVSIEPRTLVPRVIRDDNRYEAALKGTGEGDA